MLLPILLVPILRSILLLVITVGEYWRWRSIGQLKRRRLRRWLTGFSYSLAQLHIPLVLGGVVRLLTMLALHIPRNQRPVVLVSSLLLLSASLLIRLSILLSRASEARCIRIISAFSCELDPTPFF